LTLGEIAEVLKFKINSLIPEQADKLNLAVKDRLIMFNQGSSISDAILVGDIYQTKKDEDGWLYLDFIIDCPATLNNS
jgi:hypothetical protein